MKYKCFLKLLILVCALFSTNITFAAVEASQNIEQTKNISYPIIKVSDLNHIGIVVKNLDQSMQEMWQNFGIGPWKVYIYEPNQLKDVKYFGKPSKSGMKIALAQIGNTLLELAEPIGKDNIYYAFMQKNGEGIEHFGYYKVKNEADFFVTVKKLEAAGFPCMWSGLSPKGNRFAYIDTSKVLHTGLEVIWMSEKAPVLKPNRVFPKDLN